MLRCGSDVLEAADGGAWRRRLERWRRGDEGLRPSGAEDNGAHATASSSASSTSAAAATVGAAAVGAVVGGSGGGGGGSGGGGRRLQRDAVCAKQACGLGPLAHLVRVRVRVGVRVRVRVLGLGLGSGLGLASSPWLTPRRRAMASSGRASLNDASCWRITLARSAGSRCSVQQAARGGSARTPRLGKG